MHLLKSKMIWENGVYKLRISMATKTTKKASTTNPSINYTWDNLRDDIDHVLHTFAWFDTDIQWTKHTKVLRAKYPEGWNLLWQKYMNHANTLAAKNKDAFVQIQQLRVYISSSEAYKKYASNAIGPFWAFIRDIELLATIMYANIHDEMLSHALSRLEAWKNQQFLIADIQNKLVAEPVRAVAKPIDPKDSKDSKKSK